MRTRWWPRAVNDAATSSRTRTSASARWSSWPARRWAGCWCPGPVLHLGSYAGPVYDGVPAIGEHTERPSPSCSGWRRRDRPAGQQ
jgi:hypothetical protein